MVGRDLVLKSVCADEVSISTIAYSLVTAGSDGMREVRNIQGIC